MEEINEESITEMLKQIPDNLSPVERLIICNEGTVQTLLSVLFKVPVKVVVLSQRELCQIELNKVIIRWSKLVACYEETEITVCLAESVITSNNQGFITGIREKTLGIGQLISSKALVTRRRLLGFNSDQFSFARNYIIEDIGMTPPGSHVNCLITEVFMKEAFTKASVVI